MRLKRDSTLPLVILALLLAFPGSSNSQTKKKPGTKRSTAAPTPTPAADMRAEANKVAEQIKNATRFLYIYGKIVNGLELAEEQAKLNQVSPAAAAQNQKNKETLITNISSLRAGLDALTKSFQDNPRLQVQYLKLSYAVEAATNAEKLAKAGQYNEAGKSLVAVIERLTDAMTSMRLL